MKTIRLTILSTSLTLLILAFVTYWLLTPCHPQCTPGLLQPFMPTFQPQPPEADHPSLYPRPDNTWKSPMEESYRPSFIDPTFMPPPN